MTAAIHRVAEPRKESIVRAVVGDQLIVRGHLTGMPDRKGEVIEVRGPNGAPPYLVRWDDSGHTTLFFPGSDCIVQPLHHQPVS